MDALDIAIRVGAPGDWDAISELLADLFHDTWSAEESDTERSVWEPARSLVAEDGDRLAGHAAAYSRELTVPGAVVPAAHVTLVGVAPTHRRRGLLTAMMRRQLREIAAAGREPIAVLWASETKIYPRFGYGPAARRLRLDISTTEVRLPAALPPAYGTPSAKGRLRRVDPGTGWREFAGIYERLRPERPGWSSRDEAWWKFVLADFPASRHGATRLHGVIYETPDGPAGYAVWRTKDGWTSKGHNGEVQIREFAAADPESRLELWRFLLSLDLVRSASYGFAPLDEPLQFLVDEPRRLGSALADGLWVRIVDLPRALAARRYAAPLDVVFEVTDAILEDNAGRWRLTVAEDGAATCTRTGAAPDLACDVLQLGSAYLGATSPSALAAGGLIRELTPGALRRTTASFGWDRMPQPSEVF